ncbi:MAG TPA: hypothetical protein VG317_21365 [Pseudonocardiaceae bacterium]|nr:hypothetical protein [Pseudonocardiaceae bacterium]
MSGRVVVLGGGSLGRAVCTGLATVARSPLRVWLAARDRQAAEEICQLGSVLATASGSPVGFTAARLDLADQAALRRLLADAAPAIVLLCASTQSPWEGLSARSAWTDLTDRAGIALALPLHAEFAVTVGAAAADTGNVFLNACFPDAVNPVLAALGIPVLAGVGNVATTAAALRAALDSPDPAELVVLAHHLHLHEPERAEDDALAWYRGRAIAVGPLLAAQRAVSRREANQLAGHLAARLLAELAAGQEIDTHLPGPAGRTGGYPVHIGPGDVTLRLPARLTEAEAVARNQHWAWLEGVVVADGRVRFTPSVADRFAAVLPGLADGFAAADALDVARWLGRIRDRLRTNHPVERGDTS